MASAKSNVKTNVKSAKKKAKSMVNNASKSATRVAKIVSAKAPRLGGELASVAHEFSKVLKKSHVKEGFNGSLDDAEKFMKHVLNDNDSLKKFVKIVKKSLSKSTSKRA